MDALIRAINNKSSTFHAVYSTPSCYTKAVYQSTKALTNKTEDFFPYAHKAAGFWTGYFTSRPSLKRIVRDLVNKFTEARQLMAFSDQPLSKDWQWAIFYMKDAEGILQHHDAVTGTAKQHVTDDYRLRGSKALDYARDIAKSVLSELHCGGKDKLESDCLLKDKTKMAACPLLNETKCEFTEAKQSFTVVTYNQMAEPTTEWLRVPVAKSGALKVVGPDGKPVAADLVPVPIESTKRAWADKSGKATHELVFKASVPALGSATYFVESTESADTNKATEASKGESSGGSSPDPSRVIVDGKIIDNGVLKLTLDDDNRIKHFEKYGEGTKKVSIDFAHYLAYYEADAMPAPPSGAYLFNPKQDHPVEYVDPEKCELVVGKQVVEIRCNYISWAQSIISVYAGQSELEIKWVVGPIPNEPSVDGKVEDAKPQPQQMGRGGGYQRMPLHVNGIGREVVSVFKTSIANNGVFYTDTNGREMLKRTKDTRAGGWKLQSTEPVSQNYYPLNGRISTKDSDAQMTLIVDRACGGTGYRNGQLEIMLHRRLTQDDQLGVNEALQEIENGRPLIASGRHWIMVDAPDEAAEHFRKIGQKVMFPVSTYFSDVESRDKWLENNLLTQTSYGKQGEDSFKLPNNVNLLTFERGFTGCDLLVRLEHLFQGGESSSQSKTVDVDFQSLMLKLTRGASDFEIEERALGANMKVEDLVKLHWDTTEHGPTREEVQQNGGLSKAVRYDELGKNWINKLTGDSWKSITLLPMQIRTFCINIKN